MIDIDYKEKYSQIKAKAARHSFSDGWASFFYILFFMHYVYLIRSISSPESTYIGNTVNLYQRLDIHNSGGSIHTKQHRPWELILFLGFKDKLKATAFEKYLKSGAGRAFAQKRFW